MAESDYKGDLLVNNLIYRQPKSLSLATNRTARRQQFYRDSYTSGETAIIKLNTGSDHLKLCNSYLTFNMLVTGTTPTANFANGSAVNVIQNITVRGKSGTEYDRLENVALWSKNDARHTYSQDWFNKYGTMVGYGTTGIGATDAANLSATNAKFCIPLSMLAGVFRPIGGVLMPPQMAAGLEITITLADYKTALFTKGGTVTGYTLSNIAIVPDCVTLSEDTQKTLNLESAETGLEYTYPRIHTATSTAKSTAVNVQVQKSVAQASLITAVVRTQSEILDVTKDSLKSAAWGVTSWQFRIGSLYFPSEVLSNADDAVESFFIGQSTYDKSKHGFSENAVSVTDFKTNGYGLMSASFERDQSLNLSGMPVNNSRSIELNATLASWSVNLEVTLFLEYVAVARLFIDNSTVSI